MNKQNQRILIFTLLAALVGGGVYYWGIKGSNPDSSVNFIENNQKLDKSIDDSRTNPLAKEQSLGLIRSKSQNKGRWIDSERVGLRRRLNQALGNLNREERRQELIGVGEFVVDANRIDLALEFIEQIGDINDIRVFLSTIVLNLVKRNPDEALVWLNDFRGDWASHSSVNFDDILTPIIIELSEDDIDTAYRLIDQQEDEKARDRFLTRITQSLIKSDIPRAADWVELLPPGEHRNKTLFKIGFQWAQMDTESASQWITNLPEDEGKDKAIEGLVNIWTSNDPDATANWAIKLQDSYTREIAVFNVVDTWTYRDPQRVSEWVETFPESELKIDSFSQAIEIWSQYDPDSATKWLKSITDEKLQRIGLNIISDN